MKLCYKVWIFDMITETEKGKELVKSIIKFLDSLRIIIGGGDGSIMSFIECLGADVICSNKCYFGVVPLGTGNDLARSLNFGGKYNV